MGSNPASRPEPESSSNDAGVVKRSLSLIPSNDEVARNGHLVFDEDAPQRCGDRDASPSRTALRPIKLPARSRLSSRRPLGDFRSLMRGFNKPKSDQSRAWALAPLLGDVNV